MFTSAYLILQPHLIYTRWSREYHPPSSASSRPEAPNLLAGWSWLRNQVCAVAAVSRREPLPLLLRRVACAVPVHIEY